MVEGAAEVSKQYQFKLEEEKARLVKDVDSFKQKVWTPGSHSSSNRVFQK